MLNWYNIEKKNVFMNKLKKNTRMLINDSIDILTTEISISDHSMRFFEGNLTTRTIKTSVSCDDCACFHS